MRIRAICRQPPATSYRKKFVDFRISDDFRYAIVDYLDAKRKIKYDDPLLPEDTHAYARYLDETIIDLVTAVYLGEENKDGILNQLRIALTPLSASADVVASWGKVLDGSRHALAAILMYTIAADQYLHEKHDAKPAVEWIWSRTQEAISCALRLHRCKSVLNDYVLDYIMIIFDAMHDIPMSYRKTSAMCEFNQLIFELSEAAKKFGRCRICAEKGISYRCSHFSSDLMPSYLSANVDVAVASLYHFLPHYAETVLYGVLSDAKEAKDHVNETSRRDVIDYAEAVRDQMPLFGHSENVLLIARISTWMTFAYLLCVLVIVFCMCYSIFTR